MYFVCVILFKTKSLITVLDYFVPPYCIVPPASFSVRVSVRVVTGE